jgi:hypothetical protein
MVLGLVHGLLLADDVREWAEPHASYIYRSSKTYELCQPTAGGAALFAHNSR